MEVGRIRALPVDNLRQDSYDVFANGQEFLVAVPREQPVTSDPLTVVQNWTAGFKK